MRVLEKKMRVFNTVFTREKKEKKNCWIVYRTTNVLFDIGAGPTFYRQPSYQFCLTCQFFFTEALTFRFSKNV